LTGYAIVVISAEAAAGPVLRWSKN